MLNPFESIEKRLDAIQNMLVDLRFSPVSASSSTELISASQLRERLGICKASERSYVQAGLLKPQYLGRRVFYRWDEVSSNLSSKPVDLLPTKLRTAAKQKTAFK